MLKRTTCQVVPFKTAKTTRTAVHPRRDRNPDNVVRRSDRYFVLVSDDFRMILDSIR